MPITALPTPPNRGMSQDTFDTATGALLGALPTFVTEANTQATANNTAATTASAASSSAATSAAAATAAIAALTLEYGIYVSKDAGVAAGGYPAAFSIPSGVHFVRFYAKITGGSGTATVVVRVNGVDVYGPISISTTAVSNVISLTAAQGSDIVLGIGSITGTVTSLVAKIEGVPV
jgi:hypothetical protein